MLPTFSQRRCPIWLLYPLWPGRTHTFTHFVGILAVSAPVLGPWITKNASSVRSRTSKNRSKTSGQGSASRRIATIGAEESTHRLEGLAKDGRRGWTEISSDSEERIAGGTQNVVAAVSAKRSDEDLDHKYRGLDLRNARVRFFKIVSTLSHVNVSGIVFHLPDRRCRIIEYVADIASTSESC
ncbi:hypothetical protein LX32DRAFT_655792 [Colletotrichum zoysiae]|uniref:Uncharacterized protein n=1 Tax=Colletotrichum zoysiae TaxID=1216348 RepID=A0AAD9LXX8_9PEZI|nr:hypothetical protein LX32DRAFT_655792 [Colletotrichum zoysiae]